MNNQKTYNGVAIERSSNVRAEDQGEAPYPPARGSRVCSVCGKRCDDAFGYGPEECHCSAKCHDTAILAHAREHMTPAERDLYDDIHKIAAANKQ